MKKTIGSLVCLILSVMITACGLAADYTLPEKMDKQLAIGSGLKGSFTLHAEGKTDALQGFLPFLDKEISLRGMKSGDDAHYYIYQAGENEQQNALTELYLKEGSAYFRSDLLNGRVYSLPDLTAFSDQVFPSGGENPPFASMMIRAQQSFSKKKDTWDSLISRYAEEVEIWVTGFEDNRTIQVLPDGSSAVRMNYTIPVGELKKEIVSLLTKIKSIPEERELFESIMSENQAAIYFNPNLDYFYDAALSALNNEFDVVLSRTVSTMGEVMASEIELPLDARYFGYSSLVIKQEGPQTSYILNNDQETVMIVQNGNLTPENTAPVELRLIRYPSPENKEPFARSAVLVSVTHTTETSTDEEARDHQKDHWIITAGKDVSFLPEGEKSEDYPEMDPLHLEVTLHYFSKYSQSSPTTLEISGRLENSGVTLSLEGSFKTASPWIFSPFDITDAQDFLTLAAEQKLSLLTEALTAAGTQLQAVDEKEEDAPRESEPEPTADPDEEQHPASEGTSEMDASPETEADPSVTEAPSLPDEPIG